MKKIVLLLVLLLPISFSSYFQMVHAKVSGDPQAENKVISEKEAGNIALKKVKGKIVKVVLEEDDGRSVYEVKIKSAGIFYEVEIDAKTGKVLEVEKEGSNGDDDRHGNDDHEHGDDDGHGDDDHGDD
ncbi:PepSY domain-containing protein [Bacillus xiapuensis]|uniref:PepSY domain-containing protein n=1 Tax=Bacillus xiapuensis TaxID=2014075 RepID=A0ABU6NE70_9BACI|nr:PepSY domain-containing protein [Bacillus xiapuensis]